MPNPDRCAWSVVPPVVFLVIAFLCFFSLTAVAALDFPALTGRVVDEAGLLSPEQKQNLTRALTEQEEKKGNQVVVVTLKSLRGISIEDYGYQLGRHWQIGRSGKDDGVLLIVAPNERKVRIEVGYGLEGVLTDAATRLIIENVILPDFRQGDYGGGIVAGTDAILKMLSDEEPIAEKRAVKERQKEAMPIGFIFLMLLFVFFAIARSRGGGGRQVRGRRGSTVIVPPIGWGGGGGGFGGGGFGSGGGGGFSGGGGSFGGGGASGDW